MEKARRTVNAMVEFTLIIQRKGKAEAVIIEEVESFDINLHGEFVNIYKRGKDNRLLRGSIYFDTFYRIVIKKNYRKVITIEGTV